MSTKMSTDLNLTRPSSRVIRPPGGASSNIFGLFHLYPTVHCKTILANIFGFVVAFVIVSNRH
jgi:hypothetical protein